MYAISRLAALLLLFTAGALAAVCDSAKDTQYADYTYSVDTEDTGIFWFFDEDNIEMVVKVLDACGLNERFWMFAGGLTGETRTYNNDLGQAFAPLQDTDGFATCD